MSVDRGVWSVAGTTTLDRECCRGICENVFHFFTLTCRKPPNSFGILQPLSNKTNRNTTTVPAEGNSSKRPIVFKNCQVTNNKKKNIPENDKQKVLFI
jgi:hypothetical protein